jgi:hypothetical protein
MSEESQVIVDSVDQEVKFTEIQVVDEILDALDESTRETKKELRDFRPTVQAKYVQMKQLDSVADSGWNTLLATQP